MTIFFVLVNAAMTIILKALQFNYETISIRGGVHQLCLLTSAIIHPRGVFYTFNSRFTQYSTKRHQKLQKNDDVHPVSTDVSSVTCH